MKLKNEFNDIRRWAYARGLYQSGDLKTQLIKLQEEVGELAKAVLSNNRIEVIDAIGDSVIVLTNLARLAEQHFSDKCLTCHGHGGELSRSNDKDGIRYWVECNDCGKINIETCINKAFEEIAHRTGKMSNGTFKKDN